MVTPANCLAASAARKAEPSFGPSVEAAKAAACAWPSGVLGSANSPSACASAIELTEPSSAPDSGIIPSIWPKRLMKVRRVGSPRSSASTSADKPAQKSRFSRSFIVVLPPL